MLNESQIKPHDAGAKKESWLRYKKGNEANEEHNEKENQKSATDC